ncbi:hypothetical protein ACFSTA_20455 [Ornithinibacillus salinisoli]|uniref:Uncharacterized protein n=1 Tax=Ornithinibacillus salinisoli TaxID=1848459 RepID=A0ABW4W5L7_9BACI
MVILVENAGGKRKVWCVSVSVIMIANANILLKQSSEKQLNLVKDVTDKILQNLDLPYYLHSKL